MKLFVCALAVLALIAAFCVFGTAACTAFIDEMTDLLDTAAPQGGAAVPANAGAVSGALLERWNEHFFCISMLLPHHHLDDVKNAMVALDSYAQTDEYPDWRAAHERLHEALTHLRGLLLRVHGRRPDPLLLTERNGGKRRWEAALPPTSRKLPPPSPSAA